MKELLESILYSGVVKRAKKRGTIDSNDDLLKGLVCYNVSRQELVNIRNKREKIEKFAMYGTLTQLPISAAMIILSHNRNYLGLRLVPEEPAYDSTVMVPNGNGGYTPVVTHHESVPAHYEKVYDYFIDKPELFALAIAIPFAIIGGYFLANKWLDLREEVADNLSEIVKQRKERFSV